MKLTREQALKYHRQMWGDMLKDIGDTHNSESRNIYKAEWCKKHFPNEEIGASCFLCEYDENINADCTHCPIEWPHDETGWSHCCKDVNGYPYYIVAPISEILALPERKLSDE